MKPLPWKDFLNLVEATPDEALTPELLLGLVERLELDASLLAPYIQFKDGGYCRNVLYRSAKFEAICLCWQPGQATSVHDHGRSFGALALYEGQLMVEAFRRDDDGQEPGVAQLTEVNRVYLAPGALLLDREGSIHRLSNRPESTRRAISLHFYARPLEAMTLYHLETGTTTLQSMQGEPLAYIEPEAHVMAGMI